jgi:transposase-like protein
MLSCKRKQKTLSLEDKTAILRRREEGESVARLAKEFGIGN